MNRTFFYHNDIFWTAHYEGNTVHAFTDEQGNEEPAHLTPALLDAFEEARELDKAEEAMIREWEEYSLHGDPIYFPYHL